MKQKKVAFYKTLVPVLGLLLQAAVPLQELPELPGWKKLAYPVSQGQQAEAYGVLDRQQRPVLLMVTGSKCIPLFLKRPAQQAGQPERLVSRLFIADAGFYRQHGVHALAIERKGLHSFQPVPPEVAALPGQQRCSSSYGGLTKTERVEDLYQALLPLLQEPWFGKLLIMGHSEGVDVALGLAKRLPAERVQAVGLFAGATTSLLFDFVAAQRQQAAHTEVQQMFEDILWVSDPQQQGKFGGYPIERMRSFAIASSPLDDALSSDLPLYVVNGLADSHASPLGSDAFVIELLRKQPMRSLRYVTYEALDHDLLDAQGQEHSPEVFSQFINWALQLKPGQTERVYQHINAEIPK